MTTENQSVPPINPNPSPSSPAPSPSSTVQDKKDLAASDDLTHGRKHVFKQGSIADYCTLCGETNNHSNHNISAAPIKKPSAELQHVLRNTLEALRFALGYLIMPADIEARLACEKVREVMPQIERALRKKPSEAGTHGLQKALHETLRYLPWYWDERQCILNLSDGVRLGFDAKTASRVSEIERSHNRDMANLVEKLLSEHGGSPMTPPLSQASLSTEVEQSSSGEEGV